MKQKFLFTGLMLLFSLSLSAETYSGTCGTNLTWTLDTESGILTISGTGKMTDDYSSPWDSYRSYLTTVIIEDGVTSIGDWVFRGCSSLTSVTIGNSVTSIGDHAFYECSSLTSVTIPNSVTSIGYSAFTNCYSLTSVTIGNGVTSIGDDAFWGCSSLTSVTINSNAIMSKTYSGSQNLKHVFGAQVMQYIIGNDVTSIGGNAFYYCSSLTSVTIPNSVTNIGESAFTGCSSLTSVTIPNSVASIGDGAFRYCSSLTSVTIGNSVTSIGGNAFYYCSSLTSITIPNSVTSIGQEAFRGCSSLTSVTIPNSVTSIGEAAFSFCSNLTSITIPNSVTSIEKGAFYGCSSLTSVTIPNSVTSIGTYAFSGCSSLTSVTIPNSVTSIGGNAFYYCSSLTSITIPNSVTNIGNNAFEDCYSLTSVTIPNSVISIGYSAFTNVPNIVYTGSATGSPWGARSVNGYVDGYLVYSDASKATLLACSAAATGNIVIPNSVTSIADKAFFFCSSLTSVTIPNSVTSIGTYAFYGCSSLTSVTIPNSVTNIGEEDFAWCSSLKNVVLGSSVKVLGKEAFYGCKAIETITCYSMRPPTVEDGALEGVPYSAIVYVPADSYDNYYNHDTWGLYDVRRIGAASTETNDVQVTPTETTADVVWPVVTGAASYELVIRDKNGNIICTLVFNANGQLTSITFNAPGRDNAPDNVQKAGFSFTVSGLKAGTTYNYTLTAKDSGGNTLDTRTGSFKTIGEGTAVEETEGMPAARTRKVMRDGVMYILMPDGRMYDSQGTEL